MLKSLYHKWPSPKVRQLKLTPAALPQTCSDNSLKPSHCKPLASSCFKWYSFPFYLPSTLHIKQFQFFPWCSVLGSAVPVVGTSSLPVRLQEQCVCEYVEGIQIKQDSTVDFFSRTFSNLCFLTGSHRNSTQATFTFLREISELNTAGVDSLQQDCPSQYWKTPYFFLKKKENANNVYNLLNAALCVCAVALLLPTSHHNFESALRHHGCSALGSV